MKPRNVFIGALAVLLFVAVGYLTLPPRGPETSPDITLVTSEGESLALNSLRGRPVLVTFWATTCPTCVREIPHLVKLHKDLGPRGLEVIGIAMYYDPPNQVLAMRESRNIPYTIALDMRADAAHAFGDISVTPSSFLIAPDGRIVYRQAGSLSMDRLRKRILTLLDDNRVSGRLFSAEPMS
jgi:peroxiredoxin